MKLKTYLLSSLAKVFLDEEPINCLQIDKMTAFKNERASFQIAFSSDEFCGGITFLASKSVKVYRVKNVPSIKPVSENIDDYYLRTTPGLYPDILEPYKGEELRLSPNVWHSFWIESDTLKAGENEILLTFLNSDNESISENKFTFDIIDADLPAQELIYTNWFHTDCLSTYYNVPVFSDKYWQITDAFAKTAYEHGMNMILTPLFTPPLDTKVGTERPTVQLVGVKVTENGYEFDFSKLKRWLDMCKKIGIKYFEMSHLFTQWGALHAPKVMAEVDSKEKRIFGWETDSTSKEYTEFITALCQSITPFLEKEGVADNCFFHVSDEPGEKDIEVYGKLSSLMHKLFGKRFRIIDALSDFEFYKKGYVTLPIPSEADIENFHGNVPHLWTYYCCGPTDRYYSNRFMAMPLQRTRIIGMQMYKYGVEGFLHWGYNFYYTQLSVRSVDPFAETDADSAFSSGDAFVVYPSSDYTAYASIRIKAFNEALQDMRALKMLEMKIGKEKVLEIIEDNEGEKYEMSFTNYVRSEEWHIKKREEINRKIKEMLK